jgi:hypothetical protein
MFGQLPAELLHNIIQYLNPRDLTTVACVSPALQAVAERRRYHQITAPYGRSFCYDDDSDSEDKYNARRYNNGLYPLYRTLSARIDLAKEVVKRMNLTVSGCYVNIPVPPTNVLLWGLPFSSKLRITLFEANMAGALFQTLDAHHIRARLGFFSCATPR